MKRFFGLLFSLCATAALGQGSFVSPDVRSVTVQKYVTSANSTYTPNVNILYAVVECVGQGGGGGGSAASATGVSSGGGGGSGSYSRVYLTATAIGASQAVTNTVSANGGATGNNAGTGGTDTSFGSLCIGKGGSGGGGGNAASGTAGAGGVAGTGDIAIVGNAGTRGGSGSIITTVNEAGLGAPGPWGGMPAGVIGAAAAGSGIVNGNPGVACGAGGGGGSVVGSASTAAGGQGGPGCVIVTEFNSK